eukprot:9069416-Pyramimonas_sp.AAC.1
MCGENGQIETPRETLTVLEDLDEEKFQELRLTLPNRTILARSKIYRACALVGESGALLREDKGGEIDAHDMVRHVTTTAPLSP